MDTVDVSAVCDAGCGGEAEYMKRTFEERDESQRLHGAVVGGIALAKFGMRAGLSVNPESAGDQIMTQGAWIENGLIDVRGAHKPIF